MVAESERASVRSVAVLGAGGIMGFAMARNLLGAGLEVRAWNRTRAKAEPLGRDGATVAETPTEVAEGADVILTILADTDALLAVMDGADGALAGASEGTIWLQMSTIGERGTARCVELAAARGVELVDAPVLGTKQPAEQGELVVMASGPDRLRARLEPIFGAVGKRTMWVGEAGAATRLKIVINNWILAVVEGTAETIALAEGVGVDPELFFEALRGGPLDLPYLQMKGKAIVERDFEPAFKLALAAKDARLVEESARDHGLDLPLAATVRRQMEAAKDEHGDEDMCATYWASAPAGVA